MNIYVQYICIFFVFLHYVHMRSVKSKVNMYLLS